MTKADKSVTKKTCLLARRLSEEETKLLITSCKANKCTVKCHPRKIKLIIIFILFIHGAITAATHLTTVRILHKKKHNLKTPVSVESSYTIRLRKGCEPKINKDEFGVYVALSPLSVQVPLIDPDDKQGLWELARACTREVHAQLDSGKHLNVEKLYHCVDIADYCNFYKYDFNEGRTAQILNISNCGAQQFNQSLPGRILLFKAPV